MKIETVNGVSLAKHLLELSITGLRSKNTLHHFAGINLLHDSVEAFLLAVLGEFEIPVDQTTKYDKYFSLINEKIAPKELSFRGALSRLNRIRIASKHHGIQPPKADCDQLLAAVREFFEESATATLGVSFSAISAIGLLDDGPVKELLQEAEAHLDGDPASCLIACRKALFLLVERRYDIVNFKDGKTRGLLALGTLAPTYAQSKAYIDKYVLCPTDFIVLDRSRIDQDLLKAGIDPIGYWNVWRLTPEVYKDGDRWVVKNEFAKLSAEASEEHAQYVFTTSTDIALGLQTSRRATKSSPYSRHQVELAREGVPVYGRADRESPVVATTPPGLLHVLTEYCIGGLADDASYWEVRYEDGENYVDGYVHEDDIA